LCSGELGRYAVHRSIAREFDDVSHAHRLLDQTYGQLINFNFRNRSGGGGDLRQKFDQVKWTLKKVEQLVYDFSVEGRVL
jgi:predicted translin family RNA/ssDNA-binding protein